MATSTLFPRQTFRETVALVAAKARARLPEAVNGRRALRGTGPWRVHFHVPIHRRPESPLESTQDELGETLDALLGGPAAMTDHVEMETYTWSVLPGGAPADADALAAGLAAELAWVHAELVGLGLTPT